MPDSQRPGCRMFSHGVTVSAEFRNRRSSPQRWHTPSLNGPLAVSITHWWVHSAAMNSFNRALLWRDGTAPRYTQSSTVLRGRSSRAASSLTLTTCSRSQNFRPAMWTFYYRGPEASFYRGRELSGAALLALFIVGKLRILASSNRSASAGTWLACFESTEIYDSYGVVRRK